MSSNAREQLENWLKDLEIKGSVLDIGGAQYPVKGRTRRWDVDNYVICDMEKPHKGESDFIFDLNKDKLSKNEKYDNLFCLEVLEYVWNLPNAFDFFSKMLKDTGTLYLSTHFLYGLHPPKGEDCTRLTLNGIKKLLANSGLEIVECDPRYLTNSGRTLYFQFCRAEGMRLDYEDQETYHCGYLIKAKKK